jgi:DNA polymerase III subunit gamma/tau
VRRETATPVPAIPSRPSAGGPARAPVELASTAVEAVPTALSVPPVAVLEPMPRSLDDVLALFDKRREAVLRSHLATHLHLVHFEPGRIEFRPAAGAPRDLANRLGQLLSEWTGTRWLIAVSEAEGEPTLRQRQETREAELRTGVAAHPLVQAVLETFPGATIAAVRERFAAPTEGESPGGDEPGTDEADIEEANTEGDVA